MTQVIQEATESLQSVMFDGRGEAIDGLRENSVRLGDDLDRAHGRYQGTTLALKKYSVDFGHPYNTATNAVEAEQRALQRRTVAEKRLAEARQLLHQTHFSPHNATLLEDRQQEVAQAQWSVNQAQDQVDGARGTYFQAMSEIDQAARTAMAAISDSFSETNDSARDHIGALLAPLGDFLSALAEWVGSILSAVMDLIVAVVRFVAEALLIVLIAVILIVALVVAIAVALVIVVYVLAVLLLAIQLLIMTELLGVDDLTQLRLLAVFLGTALPPLGLIIVKAIVEDVAAPTPEVREVRNERDLGDLDERQQRNYDKLNGGEIPDSVDDLVRYQAMVDDLGRSEQTVVDIQRVVDADGIERWIVTLPSTKEWYLGIGTDSGAVNDGGAILPMMLTPELQGQYERAVYKAMEQAGITPDDPVMLVGFSQGGILAGLMDQRCSKSGAYNIDAVLYVGAPAEHFSFDSDTRVLAVEHQGDYVHLADLHTGGNPSNIVTIPGVVEDGKSPHNADNYADTLEEADRASGGAYTDMFSDYLFDKDELKELQAKDPDSTVEYSRTQYVFSE